MSQDDEAAKVVAFWLDKADAALASARAERLAGRIDFSVNRACYAAFYAASAALLHLERSFTRHASLLFNRLLGVADFSAMYILWPMTPLEKCMQTLRVLIANGDIEAIALAEKAIDEFQAAHDGPNRQTGALNVLDGELIPLRQRAIGSGAEFAETLFSYVDKKIAALRDGS